MLIADRGVEIVYPAIVNADILLAMTQEAADRWSIQLKDDGTAIYDSTDVTNIPSSKAKVYIVPITAMTNERLGTKLGANIVALGVVSRLTNIVSCEALERAMLKRIPEGTESFNRQALKLGFELADGISGVNIQG